MVEYDPREGKIRARDMTQEENWQLKRALDILFTMLNTGRNLTDIQRTANTLKATVGWPYDDTHPVAELIEKGKAERMGIKVVIPKEEEE